jgi:hypothetical protein
MPLVRSIFRRICSIIGVLEKRYDNRRGRGGGEWWLLWGVTTLIIITTYCIMADDYPWGYADMGIGVTEFLITYQAL